MASISLSAISGTSMEEIINAIERQRKEIEYIMMNLDDDNISSVSGDKITSLDAAKITNLTVDMAQITNLVVGTANIQTAAIGNAQIDRATINKLVVTSADIDVGAIKTALIDTGAIKTAQIDDLSVTDGKVVSLTANKLTAGIIDAANITVKNLVADNIVTGTLTIASANLIENSDFVTGDFTDYTSVAAGWAVDTATMYNSSISARILQTGLSANAWNAIYTNWRTCSAGSIYSASVYSYTDNTASFDMSAHLEIEWFDSNGTRISTNNVVIIPSQNNVWQRFSVTATAPAGTVKCRLRTHPDRNGRLWVTRLMLLKGKLMSEWQPSTNDLLTAKGITNLQLDDEAVDNRVIHANTITGDKLVIDAITAREIATKTITANEIASNTITAASGVIANAAITTAMIGDAQITSAKIKDITFDKAKGGTLTLGGSGNVNGRFQVLNAAGEVVVDLDAASGGFNTLTIGSLSSRSAVIRDTHTSAYSMYVNTSTGDDNNSGLSSGAAKKTVQGLIDSLPKFLNTDINVYVTGNTTNDSWDFLGFEGNGTLSIYAQNTTLTGWVYVRSCSTRINVYDLIINNTNGYAAFGVYQSQYTFAQNVTIYGQNKAPLGFAAIDGTSMYIYNSTIYDVTDVAIKVSTASQLTCYNNQGKGAKYGLYAEMGGVMGTTGTNPGGGTANTGSSSGGQINGGYTADFGSATPPTPPPPTDTVGTWNSTGADSYRDTYWANDSVIKQGDYGYGNNRGCWFFGTAPSTAVTGKTITKMRVYLDRLPNTGSWSSNVTVTLRWHAYTSEPAGAPTVQSDTSAIVFSSDQAKWVDLPSTFYNDWQTGTAKGIMMYDSNGSNYCGFSSSAKIEITYH